MLKMRRQSKKNYLIISTVPPKLSISDFALTLSALTLKDNLDFNSPVANTLTLSVFDIKPLE